MILKRRDSFLTGVKYEGAQIWRESIKKRFKYNEIFSNFWREKESYNYDGVTFLILKPRLFLTAPFEIKRRKRYVLLSLRTYSQTSFVRNAKNANYPRTVKLALENYNSAGKIRHLNFLHPKYFSSMIFIFKLTKVWIPSYLNPFGFELLIFESLHKGIISDFNPFIFRIPLDKSPFRILLDLNPSRLESLPLAWISLVWIDFCTKIVTTHDKSRW